MLQAYGINITETNPLYKLVEYSLTLNFVTAVFIIYKTIKYSNSKL